jgi:hypothetical protein
MWWPIARALRRSTPLQLVVPPEGTRAARGTGKASLHRPQAQVPIILAFMDYQRKVSGLGPIFTPTGDVDRDMALIKQFYAGVKGRRADQFETE